MLTKVPLRLVTVDDLGLRGAHYVALTVLVADAPAAAAAPPAPASSAPAGGDAVAASLDGLAVAVQRAAIGLGVCAVVAAAVSRRRC